MSEKPVHSRPRRLALDWINLMRYEEGPFINRQSVQAEETWRWPGRR